MITIKKIYYLLLLLFSIILFTSSAYADSRIEINSLRHWTNSSYTRVVVDVGKLREYSYNELSSPDRIYVDIYQAKLNPILHGKSIPVKNDYLLQIRIAQKSNSTVRLALDVEFEKVKRYRIWHIFDPFRIVIDIYPKEPAKNVPVQKISQPADPVKGSYSMARQLGLGIHRIVIDPGHGGRDPGCIGQKATREKNIVLDVSLRLKELLSAQNQLEVILTRETDIFVPLESRCVIANQKQADIFISIHANSNPSRKYSGIQTFYLNFSRDPFVNMVAARENATSTKNISEMKEIIEKIVKNSKIIESKELAEKTQKNLTECLSNKYKNVKNLGVKGGPFWVLMGGEMPSILVEISHLSNLKEETHLKSPQYRQQIAQGIYEGILDYIRSLGKG